MILVNAALDVEAGSLLIGHREADHLIDVVLVDEALWFKIEMLLLFSLFKLFGDWEEIFKVDNAKAENNNLLHNGKYYCMADLLLLIQHKQSSLIQASKTGGQLPYVPLQS